MFDRRLRPSWRVDAWISPSGSQCGPTPRPTAPARASLRLLGVDSRPMLGGHVGIQGAAEALHDRDGAALTIGPSVAGSPASEPAEDEEHSFTVNLSRLVASRFAPRMHRSDTPYPSRHGRRSGNGSPPRCEHLQPLQSRLSCWSNGGLHRVPSGSSSRSRGCPWFRAPP